MRKLLLFFAMLCVSIGAWATITIERVSGVYIGDAQYSGYGIYGAQAGEIAQLLDGSFTDVQFKNGASLELLKSAELVKVGDSQRPNVLNKDDLEALELLSGAKFLDIDGSTLASGANITSIKAGPAIEAVTLPNKLTKAQVNAAGAALTACNENFGSCLSLDAEMEQKEITLYPYTLGGESYNYTGDVSALTDNDDGTYSYHISNVERTLTDAEGYPAFTIQISDLNYLAYETDEGEVVEIEVTEWGQTYTAERLKVSKFPVEVNGSAGAYTYTNPFTNEVVNISSEDESNIKSGNGKNYIVIDFGSENCKYYPIQNRKYKYQYTDLAGNTLYTDESTTPDADMKISLTCDETVTITPQNQTVTVPKEGGDCDVIAYVNKAGTLYKATSLDVNDVKSATGLVISGNINNGDISVHANATDPSPSTDDDAFTSNSATPAFYLDNKQCQFESVDMSDAVIDDYKHLRVLDSYGNKLETIVFPKNLEKIPNYCCYANGNSGLSNLKNVTFPENLKSIGNYAFSDTKLAELVLPGTIQSVGDYAFYTCKQLELVEMEALSGSCTFGEYVFASSAVKHVTLSEGVTGISAHMFDVCASLESVRIPTTASTIKTGAFAGCVSLHKLTIPEGVKLLEKSVFDGAGLTDIYVMATKESEVPKIYCLDPDGGGIGTFTKKNILGNNTSPTKTKGTDYDATTSMETALSWYQEEFSDMNFGLGGNNCMIQLHYPENMKSFYNGMANLPSGWTDNLASTIDMDIFNYEIAKAQESGWLSTVYAYGSQEYDREMGGNKGNSCVTLGPTEDDLYWPIQEDYLIRLAAGYSSSGQPTAEAWRQIPLQGITDEVELVFTKKYDDTWYTMAFPWDMDDNTLFSAFNQKCEIVEFMGAEVLPGSTANEYNLIFHFDEVAKTRYMPEDHSAEYKRVDAETTRTVELTINGTKTTKKYYTYEDIDTGERVYWPYDLTTDAGKAMQKKYNGIMHMMVFAGHPYMIHPAIGASAGNPTNCTIAGVKKAEVGTGIYKNYTTLADLAEAEKVEKVVSADEYGATTKTEWTNPVTKKGGKYYFIGNINDEVDGDKGVQDMPTENGPVYFLGVKPDTYYPQYFRKAKGKGKGKWSQYSAIIVPDADAIANVEGLDGLSVGSSSGAAKGFDVAFGEWEVVESDQMTTIIDNAVAEGHEKNEPANIQHLNVVYNIKGQVVRSNSSSVEGLPKGLYIVNGKKYLVK